MQNRNVTNIFFWYKLANWSQDLYFFFCISLFNSEQSIYLKDNKNAAYNTGVSVNHGLLHNVTNTAKMVRFNWMLLAQDTCDWKIGIRGKKIELVYAHRTNMVQ